MGHAVFHIYLVAIILLLVCANYLVQLKYNVFKKHVDMYMVNTIILSPKTHVSGYNWLFIGDSFTRQLGASLSANCPVTVNNYKVSIKAHTYKGFYVNITLWHLFTDFKHQKQLNTTLEVTSFDLCTVSYCAHAYSNPYNTNHCDVFKRTVTTFGLNRCRIIHHVYCYCTQDNRLNLKGQDHCMGSLDICKVDLGIDLVDFFWPHKWDLPSYMYLDGSHIYKKAGKFHEVMFMSLSLLFVSTQQYFVRYLQLYLQTPPAYNETTFIENNANLQILLNPHTNNLGLL
jgi:hypothetical protein